MRLTEFKMWCEYTLNNIYITLAINFKAQLFMFKTIVQEYHELVHKYNFFYNE